MCLIDNITYYNNGFAMGMLYGLVFWYCLITYLVSNPELLHNLYNFFKKEEYKEKKFDNKNKKNKEDKGGKE